MNPTEIREALEVTGVMPSRKLGQNFLCDANVSRGIVDELELSADDVVVEVGPGLSSLSEHLVGRVKKVILIEYDTRLVEWLTAKFEDEESVEVIHADGAKFDVRTLFKEGGVKLLGNLPYSAGGAILRNFLKRPSPVTRAVIMVQKEFADRMMAEPRTKEFGVLSLRMQAEWDTCSLKVIPPHVFYPVPAIDSSVLGIEPRAVDLPVYDGRLFDELIRRGFAQRRKQVRKSMPSHVSWAEVTGALGVKETVRAEELTLEQWVEMTRIFDDHPLKDVAQKDDEIFDVVDANDEVVSQSTRGEVHAKGLMHRAIHLFVINKKGELFLQKRSRLKDKHPSVWDSSAAGHLDAGEDYETAGVRELEEELGIKDCEVEWIGKLPPTEGNGFEHLKIGLVEYTGAVRFPCSEVEGGLWMPLEELGLWAEAQPSDFAPGFLECWTSYLAR